MKKYRIVELCKENGLGELVKTYEIQERKWYLFSKWGPVYYKCHYHTNTDWNNQPRSGALIILRRFSFRSAAEAFNMLQSVRYPYLENYKGNLIEGVYADHTREVVFINRSNRRYAYDSWCYQWSSTLESLKQEIDKDIIIKTVRVIK